MRYALALVGVGLVVLAAAGCSEGSGNVTMPAPGSSEWESARISNNSGLPHSGAPAVTNPLPESVLSGHPCEVLTPQQLRDILGEGVSGGKRKDRDDFGPGCDWSNPEVLGGGLRIGFSVVSRDGLSAQYANTKPQVQFFRELPSVGGFPAVSYKDDEDDRFCTVAVGLANEYSVVTTVSLSFEKQESGVDSCVPAEQVAEMVVGNLKAKAGR